MDTTLTTSPHDYRGRRPIDDPLLAMMLLTGGATSPQLNTSGPVPYILRGSVHIGHDRYYPITQEIVEYLTENNLVTDDPYHSLNSRGYGVLADLRINFVREAQEFLKKTALGVVWDILNAPNSIRTMEYKAGASLNTLGAFGFFTYLLVNKRGDEVRRTNGIWSLHLTDEKPKKKHW